MADDIHVIREIVEQAWLWFRVWVCVRIGVLVILGAIKASQS